MHQSRPPTTSAPVTNPPGGLFGQLADAFARARQWLNPAAHCPIYTWCEQRGQHYDHESGQISLTSPRTGEGAYLDARILDLDESRQPIVALADEALTPDQARHEAARLRVFADRLEQLAAEATR